MAKVFSRSLLICFACTLCNSLFAQVKPKEDTFFLAKQKGLLGRLGQSIVSSPEAEPLKIATPYMKYSGRIIRSIEIIPFGFNQRLDDTVGIRQNFATRIGTKLHVNTHSSTIKNYLFFKEGDHFLPLLISDNERYLRDQSFLQEALIIVLEASINEVDIVVMTRDVFSIGGSVHISNTSSGRFELREENIAGSGHQVSVSGIYDMDRDPRTGFGGELMLKNISGSFLNWSAGATSFKSAFNSGRYEVSSYYTTLEKPLVNRYTQWTGAFEVSYNRTNNDYLQDSDYLANFQYKYNNLDLWAGYNIGYKSHKGRDSEKRLRHFVAARTFYNYFDQVPLKYDTIYNSSYANINGVLFSYSLYKQNFYRTNFIYGFGRNEDVPIGLSASLIAGWTNKQDHRRPYYGIEFEGTTFTKNKVFSSYKLRAGGYSTKGGLEDIDLLASVEHFTKLKRLSRLWLNRNFVSFSFTRQLKPLLNEPLFLRSNFGLPYFENGVIQADERVTVKLESVFYNLTKILGFRFAPFVFSDLSFLKPTGQTASKTDGYTALGGGIRTRNENLVFGTIELRGYFFPRTVDGMKNWKVELTSKLRFRFNSTFIRRPDFIIAN